MKLRTNGRRFLQSPILIGALLTWPAMGYAASGAYDNEATGGCDLSITPVQSASIGSVSLIGLVTLSLLQRRRRD